MKIKQEIKDQNPCNTTNTSNVIDIEKYKAKRQALEKCRREKLENSLREEGLEEDERKKTMDLFIRVLDTMRKESY